MKDYYAILGVSRNETPSGIRSAYRDAVRRTHPDHTGSGSTADFQEVLEAHSVLSDPSRRRQYDEALNLSEGDRARPGLRHRFETGSGPQPLAVDLHSVHPSFEAWAERVLTNFAGRGIPTAKKPAALSVEVILTPEEAASGGVLSIVVPVHEVCLACGGDGRDWLFLCPHCGGDGMVSRMRSVQVRIPQALRLGLTPEVSMETFGIDNLLLRLRLCVAT